MRQATLEAKAVRLTLPNDAPGEVTFQKLSFKKPEVMSLLGLRFVPVLVKIDGDGCQLRGESFVLTLPGRKDADSLKVKLLSPLDSTSREALSHFQAVTRGTKEEDEVAPMVLSVSTLQLKPEDVAKKKPRRKKKAAKGQKGQKGLAV